MGKRTLEDVFQKDGLEWPFRKFTLTLILIDIFPREKKTGHMSQCPASEEGWLKLLGRDISDIYVLVPIRMLWEAFVTFRPFLMNSQ